ITLAGAFGSHIDVKYAMVLGMIPDCELAKVTSAGNAAGTGARIALLNRKARDEIARVVKQVEKVETAVEPRFQEHFVHAMAIPHKTERYPHLAAEVTLPAPKTATAGPADEGRGRRRRRAEGLRSGRDFSPPAEEGPQGAARSTNNPHPFSGSVQPRNPPRSRCRSGGDPTR